MRLRVPGIQVTPIEVAAMSPIARLIARPGTSSLGSHTLLGPKYFPDGSLEGSILPPSDSILSASLLTDGL